MQLVTAVDAVWDALDAGNIEGATVAYFIGKIAGHKLFQIRQHVVDHHGDEEISLELQQQAYMTLGQVRYRSGNCPVPLPVPPKSKI